jgi:hypothetical protein
MTAPGIPDGTAAPAAAARSATPAKTVTCALLTDGSTVEIRPARPEDVAAVRDMHAAMSDENMYLRFFSLSLPAAEREERRVTGT